MLEDWKKQNCCWNKINTKKIANSNKIQYLDTVIEEINIGNKKYEMQKKTQIQCI